MYIILFMLFFLSMNKKLLSGRWMLIFYEAMH